MKSCVVVERDGKVKEVWAVKNDTRVGCSAGGLHSLEQGATRRPTRADTSASHAATVCPPTNASREGARPARGARRRARPGRAGLARLSRSQLCSPCCQPRTIPRPTLARTCCPISLIAQPRAREPEAVLPTTSEEGEGEAVGAHNRAAQRPSARERTAAQRGGEGRGPHRIATQSASGGAAGGLV